VLQDGSVWHGTAFGAKGTEVGEVVFNTSITGGHALVLSWGTLGCCGVRLTVVLLCACA
jgi:hypothetical protein